MKSGGDISGAAMAKRLASCSEPTRNRALRNLSTWLPVAAATITDADMAKIWKGLFYCVWHSDKQVNQLSLINRLSSLVETLDPSFSLRYFDSFLVTIHREWSGIDQLRLDKFYLLVRKFLNRSFALLKKHGFDRDLADRFITILKEKSLVVKPDGVSFFIAEVFLDELVGFLPVVRENVNLLLEMFVRVLESNGDRVLVFKVKVNVFEKLIECGERLVSGESDELGKIAVASGFSERLFKSASDPETFQGNRKVLFALRDRFLKLEKDFEKSGIEIESENVVMENGAEVNGDAGVEVSDPRPTKKRKKAKNSADVSEKKSKGKKKKNQSSDTVIQNTESMDAEKNVTVEIDSDTVSNNGIQDKSKTKKKDKKNKKSPGLFVKYDDVTDVANGDTGSNGEEAIVFDETVMSNLQKQFEKVAAEAGMPVPATPVNATITKKRKRAKSVDSKINGVSMSEKADGEKTEGEKSVKKVSFSMKNNLVWKPQEPLPAPNLRLPPSATPRGSALKKGVPPGPVKRSPATIKKIKAKGSSVKKARKTLKSISPALKNHRQLQGFSV